MHIIAAKAVCFGEALKPEFKEYQKNVVKNAAALAKAIARLLDNPAGAEKLAAAAAELVRTEFTVEKMAKKYEELYLDLRRR